MLWHRGSNTAEKDKKAELRRPDKMSSTKFSLASPPVSVHLCGIGGEGTCTDGTYKAKRVKAKDRTDRNCLRDVTQMGKRKKFTFLTKTGKLNLLKSVISDLCHDELTRTHTRFLLHTFPTTHQNHLMGTDYTWLFFFFHPEFDSLHTVQSRFLLAITKTVKNNQYTDINTWVAFRENESMSGQMFKLSSVAQ